jgi:hypothetical protein
MRRIKQSWFFHRLLFDILCNPDINVLLIKFNFKMDLVAEINFSCHLYFVYLEKALITETLSFSLIVLYLFFKFFLFSYEAVVLAYIVSMYECVVAVYFFPTVQLESKYAHFKL